MSISQMKSAIILCKETDKRYLLDTLKGIGTLHINEEFKSVSDKVKTINDYITTIDKAISVLSTGAEKKEKTKTPSITCDKNDIDEAYKIALTINKRADENEKFLSEISECRKSLSYLSLWDNPCEDLLKEINKNNKITLAKYNKKDSKNYDFDYLVLHSSNKLMLIFGDYKDQSILTYTMQNISRDELLKKIKNLFSKIEDNNKFIALNKKHLSYLVSAKNIYSSVMEYETHYQNINDEDEISYIKGYVPYEKLNDFKNTLDSKKSFAYIIDDADDEKTPTYLKTNKYTSLLNPVLNILSIKPGYHEKDLSFWFLSFFIIFFAMIIGDAAYGLIFLIIGLVLYFKTKMMSDAVALILVLGIFTTIWGSITGTWFGSDIILEKIPFLKNLVIPSVSSFPDLFYKCDVNGSQITQNTMIKISFTFGVVQLCLACILNVISKIKEKDLSFIADIGWFISIICLYLLALVLVAGSQFKMNTIFIGILFGFVLCLLFSAFTPKMKISKGLKSSVSNALTTFLNTISAFGNVMSYIRLFAVGIATVSISMSVNSLASPLLGGPFFIFGIIILIIGHVINIVLGILSVVVHGVRLNVMEFSGQAGVEWSGIEYKPFR